MSATDKAKNKGEQLSGKAKEKVGQVTNNPEREQEGKIDQVKSDLKSAGEKVKDAFKR
ncbi:CsbD family protein [Nocardia aurantiaca]|uniref:CsbD family protein n=1 Tax=Nocardia aurantiaca TaxID=2675850 RepID=A0A6I3L3V6_9NOCA|nr:CsbD family protein [Nocardia aurantiaca]MTE15186.1 CsbD family protein [Nocardia aurantiaca]